MLAFVNRIGRIGWELESGTAGKEETTIEWRLRPQVRARHGPSMVRERVSKDPKCSVPVMPIIAGQRASWVSD